MEGRAGPGPANRIEGFGITGPGPAGPPSLANPHFIPGGASQRGGAGRRRSVSHIVRPRQRSGFEGLGWVPLGPKRARQGPIWSRMGPYISRTPIRDSRVIHQGSSGPIGFRRVSVGTLIWHDRTRQGSTDRSTVPYWCTIDVRTHTGAYVSLTCPDGTQCDPT